MPRAGRSPGGAAKLPAGGIDGIPLPLSKFHSNPGTLEDAEELRLRLPTGSGVGQPGNGIVGNDVEQRCPCGKSPRQLSCMFRPIVDAAQ
jgi:hypothetical protein